MAIDRDKILQNAQKFVDKRRYDKAIAEYEKIIAHDPRDARTLLKIGDLQSRMEAYPLAIATYDRVAQFYAAQGFSVKAIAVYKQIRELIRKHAPHLADSYGHIVPRLADIYTQLGLTTDALAAYDEVATRYQRAGRDRDAIEVFRKMVTIDGKNPLPHLRLAEACCRVQLLDDAIESFWTASELLLGMGRPEDALKVIERILHFRQEPRFARAAAELHLAQGGREAGMQALAKLQLAFQADPKNLDTLALLARAFEAIEQGEKAIAVQKEMARIAREQGKAELFEQLVAHLKAVAPHDDQVLALEKAGPPSVHAPAPPRGTIPDTHDATPEDVPDVLAEDEVEAEIEAVEEIEEVEALDDDIELLDDLEPEPEGAFELDPPAPGRVARPMMASAPELEVVDEGVEIVGGVAAEEISGPQSFDPVLHARKAILDAESFRRLRLYEKAIEALHIALEIDPNSIDIRQKLREILVETGEREGAILETLNIATIHLHRSEPDQAEALLQEILAIEPDHQDAQHMLLHVAAVRDELAASESLPLSSYDLEGVRPSQAMASPIAAPDEPFADDSAPLPSFPLSEPQFGAAYSASPSSAAGPAERGGHEALDEILEEAEFFAAQGLFADAEAILNDQLKRTPRHPLLLERLEEVRQARALANDRSGTIERAQVDARPSDHSFDIAASLDALDTIEQKEERPALRAASDEVDVDQVFEKFKEGVRATIADSDAATHYDLGVAYKEMGLLADARSEFELASRDPQRTCNCYAMIGMIHLEQNELEEATQAYIRALEAEHKTLEQEMSLYFDLGVVYEMRSDVKSALYYFEKIARRDPGYRDVGERIAQLKSEEAAQAKPASDDDEFDAVFDGLFGRKNGSEN